MTHKQQTYFQRSLQYHIAHFSRQAEIYANRIKPILRNIISETQKGLYHNKRLLSIFEEMVQNLKIAMFFQ
jgi:hypothetical protein